MINTLYLNDLSLVSSDYTQPLNTFFNRLDKLIEILNLNTYPDINFGNLLYELTFENNKTIFDYIEKLDHLHQQFIYEQLNRSCSLEPSRNANLITFNNEISCVASFLLEINKLDEILISLPTNSTWDDFNLCFTDSDNNSFHFKHIGDIDYHADSWLQELISQQNVYSNNEEFLKKFMPLLSNIYINIEVKEHIKSLGNDMLRLKKLEKIFSLLNSYCENYWRESFNIHNVRKIGISLKDESETVKNNDKLMEERKFDNLDGEKEKFTYHCNITKGDRCYILPLYEERKILIGYIGPHLKTNKY